MSSLLDNVPSEFLSEDLQLRKRLDTKRFNSARRLSAWDATHWFIACVFNTDFDLIKKIHLIFYSWWRQDNKDAVLDHPFWTTSAIFSEQQVLWEETAKWWNRLLDKLQKDTFPTQIKGFFNLPSPSESVLGSPSLIPLDASSGVGGVFNTISALYKAVQSPPLERYKEKLQLVSFFPEQSRLGTLISKLVEPFDAAVLLEKHGSLVSMTDAKPKKGSVVKTEQMERTLPASKARDLAAALIYCELVSSDPLLAINTTTGYDEANETATITEVFGVDFFASEKTLSYISIRLTALMCESNTSSFVVINTQNKPEYMYYHLLLHLGKVYFTSL